MSDDVEVPNGYYRLRYVNSPSAKDIKCFLAMYTAFGNKTGWSAKCYQTRAGKNVVVDAAESGFSFQGSVVSGSHQRKIALLDKTNNEVVLYDADILEMVGVDGSSAQKPEDEVEEDYRTKKAALTEEFGGAKSRKFAKARQRNMMKSDDIEKTIDDIAKDQEVMNSVKAEVDKPTDDAIDCYLPVHNKETSVPREAYPLIGIISEFEMDDMLPMAKKFIDCDDKQIEEWIADKKFSLFVCRRLKRLPANDNARRHMSVLLMYLHYLMAMYSIKAAELRRKEFLPGELPPRIKKTLTEKFTLPAASQKYGRTMPAKLKDKLLFHILALCLHIEEFNIKIPDLNDDLPVKDLIKYFLMLGCKVKKLGGKESGVKNNFSAVLKAPLVFPELLKRPRKRGYNAI